MKNLEKHDREFRRSNLDVAIKRLVMRYNIAYVMITILLMIGLVLCAVYCAIGIIYESPIDIIIGLACHFGFWKVLPLVTSKINHRFTEEYNMIEAFFREEDTEKSGE